MNIDWSLTWTMVLAISTAIMALAIIIAGLFANGQLESIKKARYSDLLMRFDQIWDSVDYTRSRQAINSKAKGSSDRLCKSLIPLEKKDCEEYYDMIRVPNFFESLGLLTCRDYLKRRDALELFGDSARRYWGLFSKYTEYMGL